MAISPQEISPKPERKGFIPLTPQERKILYRILIFSGIAGGLTYSLCRFNESNPDFFADARAALDEVKPAYFSQEFGTPEIVEPPSYDSSGPFPETAVIIWENRGDLQDEPVAQLAALGDSAETAVAEARTATETAPSIFLEQSWVVGREFTSLIRAVPLDPLGEPLKMDVICGDSLFQIEVDGFKQGVPVEIYRTVAEHTRREVIGLVTSPEGGTLTYKENQQAFEQALENPPDIAIFECGINVWAKTKIWNREGEDFIPTMEERIIRLLQMGQEKGKEVRIVIINPPLPNESFAENHPQRYERVKTESKKVEEMARRLDPEGKEILVITQQEEEVMGINLDKRYPHKDAYHLTEEGYKLWAKDIAGALIQGGILTSP